MQRFKKPTRYDYDLIVIGSGAGGGVAAHIAANEGKKVAIIESKVLGGDSPNYGCIPTKALLKATKTLNTTQSASHYGIKTGAISYNFRSVQAFKDKAIDATGVKYESNVFKHQGIHVIRGKAHFISPWIISLGLKHVSARKFLIATGSLPLIPNIPGLNETGFITYKQASKLMKPPKSMFIIGGGPVAYEYAQIYSSFGTKVYIAELRNHLLPFEDPEVGDSAEAMLTKRGVVVRTNAKVVHCSGNNSRKIITYEHNDQQHRVACEELMIATGKYANCDLGLQNTNVKLTNFGIKVDRFMRTSTKHIYAAGDVIGVDFSTHVAIQEGRLAIHNMYHRKKIAMNYHAIPRCYFGEPEIAIVGKTEHQLKATNEPYQTSIAPIGLLGKAITSNYDSGFVKIIANHYGVVIGASIVAPHASEMLGELTFAIQHHNHACAIANTIHPFPTWSEAIRIAASKIKCI